MCREIQTIAYSWDMADEDPAPKAALTKNPLGPTGKSVAANIEDLRKDQNLTFVALSERLDLLGRSIPPLGLRKIVAETRRVDADDLVALAMALGVSPATLLMPSVATTRSDTVEVTGVVEGPVLAEELWAWLTADQPLREMQTGAGAFRDKSWPPWLLDEFESLMSDVRRQTGTKSHGDD